MTVSDSEALARAKARVERNLAELESLAGNNRLGAQEFFDRYLALVVNALDAMGGVIWSVENGKSDKFAEVSFASSGYESARQRDWIDKVLLHTISTAEPCAVAVQDTAALQGAAVGNEVPYPFFYVPIKAEDGVVRFILQVWLKQAGDPRAYKEITVFLEGVALYARSFLKLFDESGRAQREVLSAGILKLQDSLLGELRPELLCEATANHLVDILPCDLALVLCFKRGKWRLLAASNQDAIDSRSTQSQVFASLASSLPVETNGAVHPDSAREPIDRLTASLAAASFGAAAWCHLGTSKRSGPNTMLLGLWHETPPFLAAAGITLASCAERLRKAMDAATLHQSIPLRPFFSSLGRIARAWGEDRRRRVVAFVIAPIVVLAAILLFPVPFKIKADCVVVPSQLIAVVAESDGRVTEVLVHEGEEVEPGQILARQEDLDFATQLEVSRQQLARWNVEAARAQALGQEAERKLADLSGRREQANIKRLQYLRNRTELKSPIRGSVLTKGIKDRAGEALQKGQVFCEVGSTQSFELQLDVQQKDAGFVLEALQKGETLPVTFLLQSHARRSLRGELTGLDAFSQLPELREYQSVFTARLPISASSTRDTGLELKAGYTGKASIRVGKRPLGWVLSRPLRQLLSLHWSL